jgi:hypothetical protein
MARAWRRWQENRMKDLIGQLWSWDTVWRLLVVVAGGLAVGLMPNVLEIGFSEDRSRLWLVVIVAVIAAGVAAIAWTQQVERGLGIIVQLYEPNRLERSRLEKLRNAARKQHGSAFVIDPDLVLATNLSNSPKGRADAVARLIDARVAEEESRGRSGALHIYPLAHLDDGFSMGWELPEGFRLSRRMQQHVNTSITVVHPSGRDRITTVPTVVLSHELRRPPGPDETDLVENTYLDPDRTHHEAYPSGDLTPDEQRRLAVIVNIAGPPHMVEVAAEIARTGDTKDPSGRATGYYFDRASRRTRGPRCGGYAALQFRSGAVLTEDRRTFEAVATYAAEFLKTARHRHSTSTGGPVDVQLFIAAPLAIVMALGWILRDKDDERITVMFHERHTGIGGLPDEADVELTNLTPHSIDVVAADDSLIITLPPAEKPARCQESTQSSGAFAMGDRNAVVPLVSLAFGEVDGLPDPKPRTHYVVSRTVANAVPERTDLVVPYDIVRDPTGQVVGCRALAVGAAAYTRADS